MCRSILARNNPCTAGKTSVIRSCEHRTKQTCVVLTYITAEQRIYRESKILLLLLQLLFPWRQGPFQGLHRSRRSDRPIDTDRLPSPQLLCYAFAATPCLVRNVVGSRAGHHKLRFNEEQAGERLRHSVTVAEFHREGEVAAGPLQQRGHEGAMVICGNLCTIRSREAVDASRGWRRNKGYKPGRYI